MFNPAGFAAFPHEGTGFIGVAYFNGVRFFVAIGIATSGFLHYKGASWQH